MNDFKQRITDARNEREMGDQNKALEMFLQLDKAQMEPNQLFDYLGELGLTYWHLKRFEVAKDTFQEARKLTETSGNKSHEAVTLRQLSRPEFNESDPSVAVEYATKARQIALDSNRQDLAWFDHGVVTALIFAKSPETEIRKWYEIEAEDLYKVSRSSKDEIAKWVWASGLLMDRAQVFNTIGDLYLALMIAEQFGLARRKEQIEKMIEEFSK
jgi:tetratricopeptide (TPR) repeat protein